jgi:MFS family permease
LAGLSQPGAHGWDLVAYRVVQGVGGALLITNSAAIVADAFKHGRVGLGLGVNQVAGAAGFLLGPVVGGLLTALIAFVLVELTTRQPMLDLSLFSC